MSEPEIWSIARIYQSVLEAELDEIAAIGDSRDDQRWKLGDYAVKWITQGLPAMWTYAAIAAKADCSISAVRSYCYTSRAFPHGSPLREEYYLLRFSAFDWARRCKDYEPVLRYALETRAGIHEIMQAFPPDGDAVVEEPTPAENGAAANSMERWPSWAWPIQREMRGLPEMRLRRAEMLLEQLRAVVEGREWVKESE